MSWSGIGVKTRVLDYLLLTMSFAYEQTSKAVLQKNLKN